MNYPIYVLILLFVFGCKSTTESESTRKDLPNVVFILVDDLGWSDVGFMGNKVYDTPNLDKLASQSAVFTNAYAAASNCAPSRACTLTGLPTTAHGIYTVASSERGRTEDRKLIPTPNTIALDTSFITIAEALKTKGYVSASIGKWHIGESPLEQGFDVNIAGNHQGHPNSYFSPYKNKDLPDGPEGEYLTDRLTGEAIKFIGEHKEQPFFLYLPYYTVHTPLQGKEELTEKYKERIKDDTRYNASYGAMVETMDENVGRLISFLEEQGLAENTLLIFTSDNGGLARVSTQYPLRAGKGSFYEGGIRVPFLMRWPEKIDPAIEIDTPVTSLDIFSTLMDVVKDTGNDQITGTSLMSVINGPAIAEERSLIWHFPIYLEAVDPEKDEARDPLFRTRPGSVIRKGKWKLHQYFEDNGLELYDLETDPGERNDISKDHPEILSELLDELNSWRKENNAPVPTELNPLYQPSE